MKIFRPLLFLLLSISFINLSTAQYTLQVVVLSGSATTTCTDIFSAPDPLWSIQVEGQGWVTYSSSNLCFTSVPHLQFQQSWQCEAEVPDSVEICLRAFENDPNIFNPCDEEPDCEASICIMVPYLMQDTQIVNLQLPAGGGSEAMATVALLSSGFAGGLNDEACHAIFLGKLTADTTLGNADTSMYNNYCATAINEPSPWGYGAGWINNRAVWFTFSTGPTPSSHISVHLKSDPSNLGDPVNLQAALWTNDSGCTGAWNFVSQNHDPTTWGEEVWLVCPQPNTTYYIMVDAVWDDPEQLEGWYGVEVKDYGTTVLSDSPCAAWQLGQVPNGGQLASPTPMSNNCSSNNTGVSPSAFAVQAGVWLSFIAPQSGHVVIDATANTTLDPVDLQLALFASSTGDCTGLMTELASTYQASTPDESLEVHCLNPGQTYFLLVDGGGSPDEQTGIFSILVSDGGDDTPITTQAITICAGDTLLVGNSAYAQSGNYTDTILLPSGCDSIVITNLSVLSPIFANLQVLQQGLNAGNTDGVAQVTPSGGAGGYSVVWSDGQNAFVASQLVGGAVYCVTITDAALCEQDTCFTMPFFVQVQPIVLVDSVSCNGGTDGAIHLSAHAGVPPYFYQWANSEETLSGNGVINSDNEMATLPNLPPGDYHITIADANTDTVFVVAVPQPAPIQLSQLDVADLSCFGSCDGQITVQIHGGTAPYLLQWSSGDAGGQLSGLCAGLYVLNVTDANGCVQMFEVEVNQPAQFVATVLESSPISCYGGSDGQLKVVTNGNPITWQWNTGAADSVIANLPEGNYEVVVTNADGCTATAEYQLNDPPAPVSVSVEVVQPIICHGDATGILKSVASGPGSAFQHSWSNGENNPVIEGLSAGTYTVTVTNEFGCTAVAISTLTDPAPLSSTASTNALNCFDPPDGGIITIESVAGGVGPYLFSKDGFSFSSQNELSGYMAGEQAYFILDSLGCTEVFFANIPGPTAMVVEAGADQVVDLGDQVLLNGFVHPPNLAIEWQPADIMSCNTCIQTTATPLKTTFVKLIATDSFGCTAEDVLLLQVLPRRSVFLPNVFSPNGDGINDVFVPEGGNDVQQVVEFKVFDRYGALLYEANNFSPGDAAFGWDGRFKERPLGSGVFVWFAKIRFIDGVEELYRGDVTILR